jgi:hypothetical protein
MRGIMGGMEKQSRWRTEWIAILIGCCFFFYSAVLIYRGDSGGILPTKRKTDPISYWIQVSLVVGCGAYVTWFGVLALREDDEEK